MVLDRRDRKDLFAAVLIAIVVSVGFYLFYGNTDFIRSRSDVLFYYLGCMVPFVLPVCVLFDKFRKNEECDVVG